MLFKPQRGNIDLLMEELNKSGLDVLDRREYFGNDGITQILLLRREKQKFILPIIYDFESKKITNYSSFALRTNENNLSYLDGKVTLGEAFLKNVPKSSRLNEETLKHLSSDVANAIEKVFPNETVD